MTRPGLERLRGLYAIVDPDQTNGRDARAVTSSVLEGGCAVLQLRAKSLPDDELVTLARDLAALCHAAGVPFVLNDRADLAVLAGADGVHLGQEDLSLADARVVARQLFIGRSTHDLSQVRAEASADLIGFGPVFATSTKENPSPVVGISLLCAAVELAKQPVVAIGGITHASLDAVLDTGVPLVAAISAVTRAADVAAAARSMHSAIVSAARSAS
jgi:thiamine-phosphate pyrophosphorylase